MSSRSPSRYVSYLPLGLFLVLAISLAWLARHYYEQQKATVEGRVHEELLSVADLKVNQISAWRLDRFGDTRSFMANQPMLSVMQRVLAGEATASDRKQVQDWLAALCTDLGYVNAILTNRSGDVVISAGAPIGNEQHLRKLTEEVIQKDDVVLRDFHRDETGGRIHLSLNVPVKPPGARAPVGALLLGIDARRYLGQFLRPWPIASTTAEALLVRREGNEAVFLNDLRQHPDAALNFRIPLNQTERPAVQGSLGREGITTGVDYRGVQVLAAIRRVPDTPWVLVAKVDVAEVYAPVRRGALLLWIVASALILAAGVITAFIYRQQRLQFYKQQYEAEVEHRLLAGRYDYLSRFANDIILLSDESGRIIEANDRAVSSYGYSRDELLHMHVRDLREPSALAGFEAQWKATEEERSLLFETLHKRKDGSKLPVEISVRFIEAEGKRFRQSIIRDVSERKSYEEKLRAIFDSSPLGIISLDMNGSVASWNRAAESIFEWPAKEVLGKRLPVISADDWNELEVSLKPLREGHQPLAEFDAVRTTKSGKRIVIHASLAPVHDLQGKVIGTMALVADVTERKRSEEELRKNRALLSSILEGTSDRIFATDRDGKFLLVNPAVVRVTGKPIEEILGKRVAEIFPPDVAAPIVEIDRRVAETKRSETVEENDPASPGERTLLTTKGPLLDEQGNVIGTFGISRDITDRKKAEEERLRLEQQLIQAQKMESVGRLAGGVAHDFNNHLTVINGYCDLLLARLGPHDPMREQITQVRKAGEQAANLTRKLLAFSRKQILDPRPLNLNDIVTETRDMLKPMIGEDIELRTFLDPNLDFVHADPNQMNQILMNLVVNARDAMPDGGTITIETSNVELDESYAARHSGNVTPGCYIQLVVSDTGAGMDQETQSKIFEPFFTTKAEGSGTGLGLATVYGVIKQSGGWIWVYSEPGKGTTFRIYLPKISAPAVQQAAPAKPQELGGSETILVVEDQDAVRKFTVAALQGYGYQVLQASCGADAVTLCREYREPIHLMVTDVVMPGMDGRELSRQAAPLRPKMKVLYMSGYTANVIARQGVLDPGTAYISKPFIPSTLAAKVREVLEKAKPSATILVADDEEGIRGFLRHILEGAGFSVLEAPDGRVATQIVKDNHVDLLLTDLAMPEQEGIETLRALRPLYPNLKIVAMSGAFGPKILKTAEALGASASLRKPIGAEDLLRVVREVLQTG